MGNDGRSPDAEQINRVGIIDQLCQVLNQLHAIELQCLPAHVVHAHQVVFYKVFRVGRPAHHAAKIVHGQFVRRRGKVKAHRFKIVVAQFVAKPRNGGGGSADLLRDFMNTQL
ncbi:hypothetical protein SDC9_140329 [bioreactor metagenome]|uniref:Uncharacterized protein n=1 Tax=bioreactor metagenome TaxID=1076179 RepID=A0A645DX60_9ZZZZ